MDKTCLKKCSLGHRSSVSGSIQLCVNEWVKRDADHELTFLWCCLCQEKARILLQLYRFGNTNNVRWFNCVLHWTQPTALIVTWANASCTWYFCPEETHLVSHHPTLTPCSLSLTFTRVLDSAVTAESPPKSRNEVRNFGRQVGHYAFYPQESEKKVNTIELQSLQVSVNTH